MSVQDGVPDMKRGYETDCGHTVRYERGSILVSRRTHGPLVEKWPYMLLRSCPVCEDPYVWMRPLDGGSA